jgi:hypothetical protein
VNDIIRPSRESKVSVQKERRIKEDMSGEKGGFLISYGKVWVREKEGRCFEKTEKATHEEKKLKKESGGL